MWDDNRSFEDFCETDFKQKDANSLPLDPSEKRLKPVELKQILALHEDVCFPCALTLSPLYAHPSLSSPSVLHSHLSAAGSDFVHLQTEGVVAMETHIEATV